jgi:Spindle and kinetochore-associated protein 1
MDDLSITVEEMDAATKTKELCTLFSTTLTSLVADAAALRQMKSLAIGINEENDSPNIKGELRLVDSIVTELEGKVRMLQEIVAEEKRSLKQMQSIKDAADAQHQVLKEMLQSSDNAVRLREEEVEAVSTPADRTEGVNRAGGRRIETQTVAVSTTGVGHDRMPRSGGRRRDSLDPRCPTPSISFERVTESEWNKVSLNIRGRITLAVVNDALLDIERVFQRKYALLQKPSREHKQLLNTHHDMHVEEHGYDQPWISEQDLRQCCAFFRNGESTARAILLILRTVRRLKQVPGKNSQVTYVYPRD